ncbi:hypothetical protein QTP88_013425 [Uroleucon formosanum]
MQKKRFDQKSNGRQDPDVTFQSRAWSYSRHFPVDHYMFTVICSLHFPAYQYDDTCTSKRKLKEDAIPLTSRSKDNPINVGVICTPLESFYFRIQLISFKGKRWSPTILYPQPPRFPLIPLMEVWYIKALQLRAHLEFLYLYTKKGRLAMENNYFTTIGCPSLQKSKLSIYNNIYKLLLKAQCLLDIREYGFPKNQTYQNFKLFNLKLSVMASYN